MYNMLCLRNLLMLKNDLEIKQEKQKKLRAQVFVYVLLHNTLSTIYLFSSSIISSFILYALQCYNQEQKTEQFQILFAPILGGQNMTCKKSKITIGFTL